MRAVPGPALVAPPAPRRAGPELVEKAVRGAGPLHPAASAAGLRAHAPAPAAPPGGPGPGLAAVQNFKCLFNKSIVSTMLPEFSFYHHFLLVKGRIATENIVNTTVTDPGPHESAMKWLSWVRIWICIGNMSPDPILVAIKSL